MQHTGHRTNLEFPKRWKSGPTFDVVGSSHNGGGLSAHYFINGMATPGVPANGTNKYLIEFEAWRGNTQVANPGDLNSYIYHPEQRSMWGDHFFPNGEVMPNTSLPGNFGSTFLSKPKIVPQLGRWYCFEVMLKANTPGRRDGRVALWLDGRLIADFPNLRLRDVSSLTIDRFNIGLHIGQNPRGPTHKWYDNVVVATSYIGPLTSERTDGGAPVAGGLAGSGGTASGGGTAASGGGRAGSGGGTVASGGAAAARASREASSDSAESAAGCAATPAWLGGISWLAWLRRRRKTTPS